MSIYVFLMYIYSYYIYIYLLRSRYCNNVRLFSKIINNTFFFSQIFRSHFDSFRRSYEMPAKYLRNKKESVFNFYIITITYR